MAPAQPPSGAGFFARGGRAARFHLEPEGCLVGRPLSLAAPPP
jgi:hypothetical protein